MSGQGAKQKHVLGLDLGQAADYTAMVSLEIHQNPYGLQKVSPSPHYLVDFVYRWPLKTPDTAILKDVAAILAMGRFPPHSWVPAGRFSALALPLLSTVSRPRKARARSSTTCDTSLPRCRAIAAGFPAG
jgi:hypothetical protein